MISFEDALQEAVQLLNQLEQDGPSNALEQRIKSILATVSGARGFLVSYLTGNLEIADHPPDFLIKLFDEAAPVVCDLLAKNLVMSSCMVLTHERNGQTESAQGSLTVKNRTAYLVSKMQVPLMQETLSQMWTSVTQGCGTYADFLKRWQYDKQQLEIAEQALLTVRT